MRVLIIEEDPFTASVYESELKQQNIETYVANNGYDGIKIARRRKIDLILMDLILSRVNGFEVLRSLKRSRIMKTKTTIIVASALGNSKDIEEAMSLGALKYLNKDQYSPKQIIAEVINVMSLFL